MTPPRLRCARCHRHLVRAAAWLAGMPLGPNCARLMKDAVCASPTPLELSADREQSARASAREAEFLGRQIPLLEAAHAN